MENYSEAEIKKLKKIQKAYNKILVMCEVFRVEQIINPVQSIEEKRFLEGVNTIIDTIIEIGNEVFNEESK